MKSAIRSQIRNVSDPPCWISSSNTGLVLFGVELETDTLLEIAVIVTEGDTLEEVSKSVFFSALCVDKHSFFADPDPAVFLNADSDQLLKKCGSGSSSNKFVKKTLCRIFFSCKRHKRLPKSKKTMEIVQIYFKIWIILQLLPIFLHFVPVFLVENLSLPDLDPQPCFFKIIIWI